MQTSFAHMSYCIYYPITDIRSVVKHASLLTKDGKCIDPSANSALYFYDLLPSEVKASVTLDDFSPCKYVGEIQVALNFASSSVSDVTFADLVTVPSVLEDKLRDIFGIGVDFTGEWLLEQFSSPSVLKLLDFIGNNFADNAKSPDNFPTACQDFRVLDASGTCSYTNCSPGIGNEDNCFSCGADCDNGCGSKDVKGITDFQNWSFDSACCIHDYCYSTIFTQTECDDAFYEDMLEICPTKKTLTSEEMIDCTLSLSMDPDCCPAWAAAYHNIVKTGGSSSYKTAQENQVVHEATEVCQASDTTSNRRRLKMASDKPNRRRLKRGAVPHKHKSEAMKRGSVMRAVRNIVSPREVRQRRRLEEEEEEAPLISIPLLDDLLTLTFDFNFGGEKKQLLFGVEFSFDSDDVAGGSIEELFKTFLNETVGNNAEDDLGGFSFADAATDLAQGKEMFIS